VKSAVLAGDKLNQLLSSRSAHEFRIGVMPLDPLADPARNNRRCAGDEVLQERRYRKVWLIDVLRDLGAMAGDLQASSCRLVIIVADDLAGRAMQRHRAPELSDAS